MKNHKYKFIQLLQKDSPDQEHEKKIVQLQQTGSSDQEHEKKCLRITKALHRISKSARYVGMTLSSDRNYLNFPADFREYIDKLALSLPPDIWIQTSRKKFDRSEIITKPQATSFKPFGIYLSKGDWLFSEARSIFGMFINLIKVDYTNIKIITSIRDAISFTEKYNNLSPDQYTGINWLDVEKDCSGIAIVPNICTAGMLEDLDNTLMWLCGYDVSTLVIWNPNNIIAYKTALNTADYISEKDFTNDPSAKLEKMINAIIISSKNIQ